MCVTTIDGRWRLVELIAPADDVDLGDIVVTLWIDSRSNEMGFRVSNSVTGRLVVEDTRLRLVPELSTLVMPAGMRARIESTLSSMLRSGVHWNASPVQLHLSDDQGRSLHCRRIPDVPYGA